MLGRSFSDKRLHYFVNSIIPFSRASVHSATGGLLKRLSRFGSEEEVYSLEFLEMLNGVTAVFADLDPYFSRGHATMDDSLAKGLLAELLASIGDDAKLRGAGLTSSLSNRAIEESPVQHLAHMHEAPLDAETYERLGTVQDLLTFSLMLPYLPSYGQQDMDGLTAALDQAVREVLGPGLTAQDVQLFASTLAEREMKGRRTYRFADIPVKYQPLMLTPRRLIESSLEHLYWFPPFLIQRGPDDYQSIVVERPFVWLKKKEIEFVDSVKKRHPNLTGDSVEELLKEYLVHRMLVFDETPPSGFLEISKPHPRHFSSAEASVHRSRNSRKDIFAVLRDPNQPSIEIDLVAHHPEGFSIMAEVKFVTRYENAEAYYYRGDHRKEAERDRLLNLSRYLNGHRERKAEFAIPRDNHIVPIFITNGVGPLFADQDGVVKACPLEVMLVEPFYRLVTASVTGVRNQ